MADQPDTFDEEPTRQMYDLVLDLDGFEGPIDLLLTLSRQQKVDLSRISILMLAEQYLRLSLPRRNFGWKLPQITW